MKKFKIFHNWLIITMHKDFDQWSIIIDDQHTTTINRQDVLTVAAFLIRTIVTISFTITNPAGMDTQATILTQFLWTFTSRTSSGTIVFIGEVTTVIVTITCPILLNAFFVSARKLIWGTCLISYWKILRKKVGANLNHSPCKPRIFEMVHTNEQPTHCIILNKNILETFVTKMHLYSLGWVAQSWIKLTQGWEWGGGGDFQVQI